MSKRIVFRALLAVLLLGGRFGQAQAIYGSLFGTVLDNTGAVVPNAKVTVTDVSQGNSDRSPEQWRRVLAGR